MPEKTGAIITGGDFQGLGLLRTLAAKGIPIKLLDSDFCISRYSKYKKEFHRSPRPSETEPYLDFLINLAKKENIQGWVIFPNSDESVYILSKYRESLKEYYRIATPPWEVIQNVYIKKRTYQIAEQNGIPIPKTYNPLNMDELLELDLQFPLVIKPSIRDHLYAKVKKKAFRIKDREELKDIYQWICSIIDPSEVLVQDFIPGGPDHLYSFCPFFKNGKILTGIAARRARQHPMDFGHASTFAQLVNIPKLRILAEKFLRLIKYYGIAEVEFMEDPRDGEFRLIEVNPRVWGWHTLAINAGADLAYFLYQDLIDEKIELQPILDELKWVRLITDIPTVITEIFKGRMSVKDYLASMNGNKTFAVLSLKDPLPFFIEIMLLPYLWIKRGF